MTLSRMLEGKRSRHGGEVEEGKAGGAVSGAWWKGPKDRCAEGYGLFDLFDDGTFKHQYVPYGWQAQA